jgi:dihydrofolate reductase
MMACDPRGIIGKNGKLPWVYPEELRYFRQTTYAHVVIMGHKTFKSVSDSFLKDRFNIVFSTTCRRYVDSGVVFVSSLDEFLNISDLPDNKKYFMIGGTMIADLFLKQNLIQDFLLTEIKKNYEGDTVFPLHKLREWPYTTLQETPDFKIKHYLNPHSLRKEI